MATDAAVPLADASPPSNEPPIQWDGDRMFNIYIHDYCVKRGFRKTALELMTEAHIPPQSQPPINAKQGLLFEWWSVFWVLFTAKSNGHGPEDALLYTQHQTVAQNAAQKQQNRPPQPGQQQPVRYANGVRPPNAPGGPQPNGVVPPPSQQQTGPLPNGTNTVPFPGNMTQPNGVPGSSTALPGAVPPQAQNMPQLPPGQRPPGPPQQRPPNGMSFQSPTMAHSPPNHPGGPNNPIGTGMGPIGPNPSLPQRGMLPPNGPQGPIGPTQHTPQPAYQPLVGHSQSNPGSPAYMAPSPSMPPRQPPGMVSPENINTDLNRIPPPMLARIKQEMNIADKDTNLLTIEEKQQIVHRFRGPNAIKPPMPGPSSIPPQPGAGPAQMQHQARTPQMMPSQQPGQQPLQGPPPGPGQQQRGAKRNSTSPGQEPEQLPRNDSSPPQTKRLRTGRSPSGADAPPMTPMYPPPHQQPQQHPQHQQHPGMHAMQPPHMQPNGMRGPMQMPFSNPPMTGMNNPMLGHGIGTPQMNPMNPQMNPGMMGVPAPGAMVNNPRFDQVPPYRQAMQAAHKPPPHLQQMLPVGVGSPSGSDGQGGVMSGGPSPAGRMMQNKPMSGMMPPPSPAMAPKGPGGQQKADDGPSANGRIDTSPRNAASGISGPSSGQTVGTPAPVSTPAPPTPNGQTMTAPSPSAILNGTPAMSNHGPPPTSDGGLDAGAGFLDFGPGLQDFDANLFSGEPSLNFERDFAAWFDPENAA